MNLDDVKKLRTLHDAVRYAEDQFSRRTAYKEAATFVSFLERGLRLAPEGQQNVRALWKLAEVLSGLKCDAKLQAGEGFTRESITVLEDLLEDATRSPDPRLAGARHK